MPQIVWYNIRSQLSARTYSNLGAGIAGMDNCQTLWPQHSKHLFRYVKAFPRNLDGDNGRNHYKYLLQSVYNDDLCSSPF